MHIHKIPDGFPGQKMIILPDSVIKQNMQNIPGKQLFLHSLGHFPNAQGHYIHRDHRGAPEHILIYCIAGEGWFSTSKGRKNVKPGQWFILPAMIPHRYGAHPSRPWSIYWIHFLGADSDYFIKYMNFVANPRPVDVGEEEYRIKMWDEMYLALESGYSRENIGIMCMSLWRFIGSFIYSNSYGSLYNRSQRQPLDATIEFMQKNVSRRLLLPEIAKQVNYSVSHFCAMFKKYTGYSPLNYFLHLKIQSACQMLYLSDLRVKEVSLQLGYDDPHFFSRLFKKTMGLSPLQYRTKDR